MDNCSAVSVSERAANTRRMESIAWDMTASMPAALPPKPAHAAIEPEMTYIAPACIGKEPTPTWDPDALWRSALFGLPGSSGALGLQGSVDGLQVEGGLHGAARRVVCIA